MIILKNREEIEKIRKASGYAIDVLLYLERFVKAGIKTKALEDACVERLSSIKHVRPAFKGYNGFPYCLCVSVNEEVVHGMPGERILMDGDIVSIDFGVVYDGYYGDAALTYKVGAVSKKVENLLSVTEAALYKGIGEAREGNRLHDISHAIQSHVEEAGFSVVRDFVGHGIGRNLHEEPQIPNYGERGTGIRLKQGMVLAIEPMVTAGSGKIVLEADDFTFSTKGGEKSAHFEKTVVVTGKGALVLTK